MKEKRGIQILENRKRKKKERRKERKGRENKIEISTNN